MIDLPVIDTYDCTLRYETENEDCKLSEDSEKLIGKILEFLQSNEMDLLIPFFPKFGVYVSAERKMMDGERYKSTLNEDFHPERENTEWDEDEEKDKEDTPYKDVDDPSQIAILGEYIATDATHLPYIVLYINNIRAAEQDIKKQTYLTAYVFVHEMVHAYLNALPISNRGYYKEVEEPITEFGALYILEHFKNTRLQKYAIDKVKAKQYCRPISFYGFGYYLYTQYIKFKKFSYDRIANHQTPAICDLPLLWSQIHQLDTSDNDLQLYQYRFAKGYPKGKEHTTLELLYRIMGKQDTLINAVINEGITEIDEHLCSYFNKNNKLEEVTKPSTLRSTTNNRDIFDKIDHLEQELDSRDIDAKDFRVENFEHIFRPRFHRLFPFSNLKEYILVGGTLLKIAYNLNPCRISGTHLPLITPDYIIRKVNRIARNAGYGCTMSQLYLLDVSCIEGYAFDECDYLTEVVIRNVKSIHIINSAFNSCRKLTKVVLPDTHIHIEEYAFNGCPAIKQVEIQDSKGLAPNIVVTEPAVIDKCLNR